MFRFPAGDVSTAATVMIMNMMSSEDCIKNGKVQRKRKWKIRKRESCLTSVEFHIKRIPASPLTQQPVFLYSARFHFITAPQNLRPSQTSFAILIRNISRPVPRGEFLLTTQIADPIGRGHVV